MRILVCGSRSLEDKIDLNRNLVWDELKKHEITEIIEAGAKGPDRWARTYAHGYNIPLTEEKADWSAYGKAAGPIRNKLMLEHKPSLVIAFWDGESRGTKDMIEQATNAGVPVKVINI